METSELGKAFTVLRFPEATHRLLSFADFTLRICELLTEVETDPKWAELCAELGEDEDDGLIADALEPAIDDYRRATGKLLLILLENFDEITDSAAVENVCAEFAAEYGAPTGTMSGKK